MSIVAAIERYIASVAGNLDTEGPKLKYSRPRHAWYRECPQALCGFKQYEVDGEFAEETHACERDEGLRLVDWPHRPKRRGEFA